MMKRTVATFAAIAVGAGMLSACGSEVSAADKAKARGIAKAGCQLKATGPQNFAPTPSLLPVATLKAFGEMHLKAAKKIKEAATVDKYWQPLVDAQFALGDVEVKLSKYPEDTSSWTSNQKYSVNQLQNLATKNENVVRAFCSEAVGLKVDAVPSQGPATAAPSKK